MSEAPHHDAVSRTRTRLRITIIAVILVWTYSYNKLIKGQDAATAFFEIIDTISDDFVMGTLLTVMLGTAIVVVFALTKLYTQIISNIYSFRIIEELLYEDLGQLRIRSFVRKLFHFEDQPIPDSTCPTRASSLLFSLGLLYALS